MSSWDPELKPPNWMQINIIPIGYMKIDFCHAYNDITITIIKKKGI